ncbi:hypothetical protein F5Y04DRAFT_31776 [Hypomontagnella monticulosa]|nr:hypothetical protein F5Y04DRAFT_31776 [Hypomontagnella monticulosa]
MAQTTPRGGSTIDMLWSEALRRYQSETRINLDSSENRGVAREVLLFWRRRPEIGTDDNQRSSDDLAEYIMSKSNGFKKARNNTEGMGKIRSSLGKCAASLGYVSSMASEVACLAFPPACVVTTAVAHIAGACGNVSDDFELIDQLFVIMSSFSDRLKLLKDRMPEEKEYQDIVSQVFCAMLNFCTSVQRSVNEGCHRLKAFAKALFRGKDPHLRAAYDEVVRCIGNLDWATVMKTLAVTLDIEEDIKGLQSTVVDGFVQAKANHVEVTSILRRQERRADEFERRENQFKDNLTQILGTITTTGTSNLTSPKFESLKSVTSSLYSGAERHVAQRLVELDQVRVKETFDWIDNEDALKSFHKTDGGTLFITGRSGMGKSVLAATIFRKLLAQFRGASTSVVYFFFDDNIDELKLVSNMLSCCAAQAARLDDSYREDIVQVIEDHKDKIDWKWEYWHDMFRSRFKHAQSKDRKLFMVLDGVNQLTDTELEKLAHCVCSAAKDKLQIFFVLGDILPSQKDSITKKILEGILQDTVTAQMENITKRVQELTLNRVKISRSGDFKRVTETRLEAFHNLARLRPSLKRRVASKIQEKADNFVYIDYTLRQLESVGSPSLISKSLDNLPNSTTEIYNKLLKECEDSYSEQERQILGYLLTWLVHFRLSLDAAQILLNHTARLVSTPIVFKIQDAVAGRLSRILTITEHNNDDDVYRAADSEDDDEYVDGRDVSLTEAKPFLGFREPSLKDYFIPEGTGTAFRPSKKRAHFLMAEMAVTILASRSPPERVSDHIGHTYSERELKRQAVGLWLEKLRESAQSASSTEESVNIIMWIKQVLEDQVAIKEVEKTVDVGLKTYCSVLGLTEESHTKYLSLLTELGKQAQKLSSESKSGQEAIEWAKNILQDEATIFEFVARRHISNWLEASNIISAYKSSRFAYQALCRANLEGLADLRAGDTEAIPTGALDVVAAWEAGGLDKLGAHHDRQISMSLFFCYQNEEAMETAKRRAQEVDETSQPQLAFKVKNNIVRMRWEALWDDGPIDIRKMDSAEQESLRGTLKEIIQEFSDTEKFADVIFQDERLRLSASASCQMKARLQALLPQERCRAVESIKRAIDYCPGEFQVLFFNEYIEGLGESKMWNDIIRLLEVLKNPLSNWCAEKTFCLIIRAAKSSGKPAMALVRQVFHESIRKPDPGGNPVGYTRMWLAAFEYWVMADEEDGAMAAAKKQLWKVLSLPRKLISWAIMAVTLLANILIEEFRSSRTLEGKQAALEEMEAVVEREQLIEGFEFKPEMSPTAFMLVQMRRRLGPASSFYKQTRAILRTCLGALRDSGQGNDGPSLYKLSRALALLPSCIEDAQIAFTCQFYKVTVTDEDSPSTDGKAEDSNAKPDPDGECKFDRSERWIECDLCRAAIRDISAESVFVCVNCFVDLCEDCYQSRLRHHGTGQDELIKSQESTSNSEGEQAPEQEPGADGYINVCPKGHTYFKAPPTGWRGVRDRKLIFDNGTVVDFDDWRDGLEEKWENAWEEYLNA